MFTVTTAEAAACELVDTRGKGLRKAVGCGPGGRSPGE